MEAMEGIRGRNEEEEEKTADRVDKRRAKEVALLIGVEWRLGEAAEELLDRAGRQAGRQHALGVAADQRQVAQASKAHFRPDLIDAIKAQLDGEPVFVAARPAAIEQPRAAAAADLQPQRAPPMLKWELLQLQGVPRGAP